MKFTSEKPTVPGWYLWRRENSKMEGVAVKLAPSGDQIMAGYLHAAPEGGEWSPRLVPSDESEAYQEGYQHAFDEIVHSRARLVPPEDVGITNVSDEMIAEIANRMMRWTIPNDLISDACMLRKQYGRTGTNMIDVINAIALVQEVVKPVVEEYIQHARRVVEGGKCER